VIHRELVFAPEQHSSAPRPSRRFRVEWGRRGATTAVLAPLSEAELRDAL